MTDAKAQDAREGVPCCPMGVGCDETGVCYAEAHGEPDRCPVSPAPQAEGVPVVERLREERCDECNETLDGCPNIEAFEVLDMLLCDDCADAALADHGQFGVGA